MSNDELTPSELEALEKLPKERMPNAALEERVIKSLRAGGVLRGSGRPVLVLTFPRALAAVAAVLLLVVGGFALGRMTEPSTVQFEDTTVNETSDISVAATLQRTGSAYVQALENFAAFSDSSAGNEEMRQGREVAIKTLSTAADKVSEFVPRRYLAGQLLEVMSAGESKTPGNKQQKIKQKEIWF